MLCSMLESSKLAAEHMPCSSAKLISCRGSLMVPALVLGAHAAVACQPLRTARTTDAAPQTHSSTAAHSPLPSSFRTALHIFGQLVMHHVRSIQRRIFSMSSNVYRY